MSDTKRPVTRNSPEGTGGNGVRQEKNEQGFGPTVTQMLKKQPLGPFSTGELKVQRLGAEISVVNDD